jgi:hypothetical protein
MAKGSENCTADFFGGDSGSESLAYGLIRTSVRVLKLVLSVTGYGVRLLTRHSERLVA